MALAHIDLEENVLNFGSVGNIEARIFGAAKHKSFVVRRGVIGFNAPTPVVTSHPWTDKCILVIHSDGLKTHWHWDDFPKLERKPAETIAHKLMKNLGKHNDDSTVVVVRSKL
jgi:serine/threonine protein phosphatase PrpC